MNILQVKTVVDLQVGNTALKKLFLLSDEWNNDQNFVCGELELLKNYYDVTVICSADSIDETCRFLEGIKFLFYNRHKGWLVVKAFFSCICDRMFWKELSNLTKEKNRLPKISEILRFYINAELFWYYFRSNCLNDQNEDLIVYSYWFFWKCFAVTKHRYKYPRLKIITRTHGFDLYKERMPSNYQPFKKIMDAKLDGVYFIAEYGLDYYLREFNIKKTTKHKIYKLGTQNDIPSDAVLNVGVQRNNINDALNIASCSSVIELKRVGLIVEALSEIDDISINWIHFGGGPLLEDVIKITDDLLSSKKNISYRLTGQVCNSVIHEYYKNNRVDAFLMMSRTEGNPVSVIEAMSYGIPVISTNITNMPNLVRGNGLLISANPSREEVAEAIRKIAKMDKDNIFNMRINSREIWEKEYNEEHNDRLFVEEVILRL